MAFVSLGLTTNQGARKQVAGSRLTFPSYRHLARVATASHYSKTQTKPLSLHTHTHTHTHTVAWLLKDSSGSNHQPLTASHLEDTSNAAKVVAIEINRLLSHSEKDERDCVS